MKDPAVASRVRARQAERIRVLSKPRTGLEFFERMFGVEGLAAVAREMEELTHWFENELAPHLRDNAGYSNQREAVKRWKLYKNNNIRKTAGRGEYVLHWV